MSSPLDSDNLYEILGVSREANEREIRKAYLNLSKEHHPDKGGNPEAFKKITMANEVLSDEHKRQMYDMTGQIPGQEGVRGGGQPPGFGGGGGFPFGGGAFNVDLGDIFGGMFGFGGRGGPGGPSGPDGRPRKRAKGPNKIHEIALRLNDFYFGKKLRFDLERQVFCEDCSGEGCLNWKTCSECSGSGVKEMMMQLGPGMMAVNRARCPGCSGQGKLKGKSCEGCAGKGLVTKPKTLETEVKAGASAGEILKFEEMCSDHPDFEKAGDVCIRLMAADEDLDVERQGSNLFFKTEISLSESLLGCKRTVKNHPAHPDGLEIEIPICVQNKEVICVKGKGMVGGDLLVEVTVKVQKSERDLVAQRRELVHKIFENEEGI
jgi:DnaJ-class molecular chaperone